MDNFVFLCHAIGQEVHWHEPEATLELSALLLMAAGTGFLHTVFGPDHYLPFIMLSWARKWSAVKTAVITFFCGIGHIAGSIVIGIIGIALGLALKNLEIWESGRGNAAAWLLTAFGLAYLIWGLRQAYRNKQHTHRHIHLAEGEGEHEHEHAHSHGDSHSHIHTEEGKPVTLWVLFIIFVFGPCEVLVPQLMYPAARGNYFWLVWVTLVFGVTTIGTMLAVVLLGRAGVNMLPLKHLNRYAHALSGAAILLCGLAIIFMGL